jgi:hypothetical protein
MHLRPSASAMEPPAAALSALPAKALTRARAAVRSLSPPERRTAYAAYARRFAEERGDAARARARAALRRVFGTHPYGFLSPGDVVVDLNPPGAKRRRALFYSLEHQAELVAPRYDQAGPAQFTDANGLQYREGARPGVLTVRIPRQPAAGAEAAWRRQWGLPTVGHPLRLTDSLGRESVRRVTGVFFKPVAGGAGIRKTGYVTTAGAA